MSATSKPKLVTLEILAYFKGRMEGKISDDVQAKLDALDVSSNEYVTQDDIDSLFTSEASS